MFARLLPFVKCENEYKIERKNWYQIFTWINTYIYKKKLRFFPVTLSISGSIILFIQILMMMLFYFILTMMILISVNLRKRKKIEILFSQFFLLEICHTLEEAKYRKKYFDAPSWQDVHRNEDFNTDRQSEIIGSLNF